MWKGFAVFVMVGAVRAEMEGFIVGGEEASISKYPHSALLGVSCLNKDQFKSDWICGSSIVNQLVLLSAGHCVYECYVGTTIVAYFGSAARKEGISRTSKSYILHQNYEQSTANADIAVVILKYPISLGDKITRVALMQFPPYKEPARVAGWGLIDENFKIKSPMLKQVQQKVWTLDECIFFFTGNLPEGTFCASAGNLDEYPSMGDSGSALVVRGYIQIGLVSFKVPSASSTVIVYTDVGHYYRWIQMSAAKLYCD